MKKGILYVAHGSSSHGASEKSIDQIYYDLKRMYPEATVYQAYYSPKALANIDRQEAKTEVNAIDTAMERIVVDGITELQVFPALMVPGPKFNRIEKIVMSYADKIPQIRIADPLLCTDAGETGIVEFLKQTYSFEPGKEYLLVAHKKDDLLYPLYQKIEEQFQVQKITNVHIFYIKGDEGSADVLNEIGGKEVTIIPFMMIAGNHLRRDIEQGENSVVAELERRGCKAYVVDKGFAEYEEFRQLLYRGWITA